MQYQCNDSAWVDAWPTLPHPRAPLALYSRQCFLHLVAVAARIGQIPAELLPQIRCLRQNVVTPEFSRTFIVKAEAQD
jgi:hypothetical protein